MSNFLRTTYLCMELGTTMVRLAEVAKKGKKVEILKTYVFDVPDECTRDGKVRLSDENILAIKEGIINSGITSDDVFFVVESTKILFKQVEIPKVKPSLIQSTLNLSFNDIFPVDESAYHISYVQEKTYKKNGQQMIALDVFAIPNDLSSSYYELSVALGLNAKGLTDASRSIISLFPDAFKNKNIAMVNIGEYTSTLTITIDGDMVFNKTVPVGIHETIQHVIDSPLSMDGISMTTAAEFLYDQNILYKTMPTTPPDRYNEEEILRYKTTQSIAALASAIEQTFKSYLMKEKIKIQEFQLSGLGAGFAGISQLLASVFAIPVKVMQQEGNLLVNPQCADETLILGCYPAAGALLDAANFFTAEEKAGGEVAHNKQVDKWLVVIGVLSILFAGGLSGTILLTRNLDLDQATADRDFVQSHIDELRLLGAEDAYNKYQLACSYEEEVLALYEQTRTVNEDMCVFLEELENLLPQSARVTSIDLSPTSASVNFVAQDKYIAAGLLHRLRNMTTTSSFQCSGVSVGDDGIEHKFAATFSLKSTEERRAEAIAAGLSEEDAKLIGSGDGYVPTIGGEITEEEVNSGVVDLEDYMSDVFEEVENNEEMTENPDTIDAETENTENAIVDETAEGGNE